MSMERDIHNDLEEVSNDKSKLMQKYSDEMALIVRMHGGNQSDIPATRDHEYWQLKAKLEFLRRVKL
jgi:hypothetical protein